MMSEHALKDIFLKYIWNDALEELTAQTYFEVDASNAIQSGWLEIERLNKQLDVERRLSRPRADVMAQLCLDLAEAYKSYATCCAMNYLIKATFSKELAAKLTELHDKRLHDLAEAETEARRARNA